MDWSEHLKRRTAARAWASLSFKVGDTVGRFGCQPMNCFGDESQMLFIAVELQECLAVWRLLSAMFCSVQLLSNNEEDHRRHKAGDHVVDGGWHVDAKLGQDLVAEGDNSELGVQEIVGKQRSSKHNMR